MFKGTLRGLLIVASLAAVIIPADGAQAIVGGQDAKRSGSTAAVFVGGQNRCVGTVFLPQWVVTSGDCAALAMSAPAQVVVGTTKPGTCTVTSKNCERVDVVGMYIDPHYTGETPAYDVGLLQLAQPVHTPPASLFGNNTIGAKGFTAGWGYTCDPLSPDCTGPATTLQQLKLTAVASNRCNLGNLPSGAPLVDPAYVACVAASDGSSSMMCIGDSGAFWNGTIMVGDGDDLESRPNFCATSPSGGQGTGLGTRIAPSLWWIIQTICSSGHAAGQNTLAASATPPLIQQRWSATTYVG